MAEKREIFGGKISKKKPFRLKVIHVILLTTHWTALDTWFNPMVRGHKMGSYHEPGRPIMGVFRCTAFMATPKHALVVRK